MDVRKISVVYDTVSQLLQQSKEPYPTATTLIIVVDGFDVIFDRFPNLKLANLVLDFAESNRAEKIVLEDVNRRLEALI